MENPGTSLLKGHFELLKKTHSNVMYLIGDKMLKAKMLMVDPQQ